MYKEVPHENFAPGPTFFLGSALCIRDTRLSERRGGKHHRLTVPYATTINRQKQSKHDIALNADFEQR